MKHREEIIGNCRLILGDCLSVMQGLDAVDHVITDPPYEAVMQNKWGVLSKTTDKNLHEKIGFDAIDEIRTPVAEAIKSLCNGWAVIFCMAEGVRAWRDCIEATGAKYKRALVWVKPDAMPQFNGQGPSTGHEMMVSAWYGTGISKWNGGGRPGTFIYTKNTQNSCHPTQKPLPLITDLVSLFSSRDETVLDPFMGSGTTMVACAKLGRKGVGIEMNPEHFDNACRRIEEAYKQGDMFLSPPATKPVQESLI